MRDTDSQAESTDLSPGETSRATEDDCGFPPPPGWERFGQEVLRLCRDAFYLVSAGSLEILATNGAGVRLSRIAGYEPRFGSFISLGEAIFGDGFGTRFAQMTASEAGPREWQASAFGGGCAYRLTLDRLRASEEEDEALVICLQQVAGESDASAELGSNAGRDFLTGIGDRRAIRHRGQAMLDAHTGMVAVFFIDFDGFKQINDNFGHAAGDEVLRATAQRLLGCIRPNDLAARYGGDELVVVMPQLHHEKEAEAIRQRLTRLLSQPVHCNQKLVKVSVSVGLVLHEGGGKSVEELLHLADLDMYRIKQSRREAAVSRGATVEDSTLGE